jgi:hypothetical protein
MRGTAQLLLGPTTSDIPADNRIYVTWRVPSKATPLRVEDLWGYFSRFGQLAFCNPRPLRHSHAPRRAPSLSGAGYAFLGFAPPGGAEAVARVLSRQSHAIRGAELRVKPWRDRDEGTGGVDAPVLIAAADVPAAPVGDYYFPHPDSGLPVLASKLGGVGAEIGAEGPICSDAPGAFKGFGGAPYLSPAHDVFPAAHEKPEAAFTAPHDKGVEGYAFDEKALFGDNFFSFSLGNDDIHVPAGGGGDGDMYSSWQPAGAAAVFKSKSVGSGNLPPNPAMASYPNLAPDVLQSFGSTSSWFDGGGVGVGVWGGNDSERISLDTLRASLRLSENKQPLRHGTPTQQQLPHDSAPGATSDIWGKSRLWNYTSQCQ